MKKNKITLLLSTFLFATSISAQDLEWGKSFGSSTFDQGRTVQVDSDGNSYVLSSFTGTIDLDPGVGESLVTSEGSNDIAIQKFDADGELLWANSFGSSSVDHGNDLVLGEDNNIYIVAQFKGTIDMDPSDETENLTSFVGSNDIAIAKYTTDGDFVWAKSIGHAGNDIPSAIAVDQSGDADKIVVIGTFQLFPDFDPGPGATVLSAAGTSDAFVLKMDADGDFVWANKLGGVGISEGRGIAVDDLGNVYAGGNFTSLADFDPSPEFGTMTSAGDADIFVAKYNSSGGFIWSKQTGGPEADKLLDLVVDNDGAVISTGFFSGTADMNPGGPGIWRTSLGNVDVFVQKLDTEGDYLWANTFGSVGNDRGRGLAVDIEGNVYSAGFFSGEVNFSTGDGEVIKTNVGGADGYYSKYSVDGDLMWVNTFGSSEADHGKSMASGSDNALYVTGFFGGTIDFDHSEDVTEELTAVGNRDVFVLKIDACPQTSSTIDVNACESYTSPSGDETWTESGTYTDIIPNVGGCDSLITINLIVNIPTSSTISVDACDSYTSPSGDETWTESGMYSDVIANAAGCDSTITINLTIPEFNTDLLYEGGVITVEETDEASYQWVDCNNDNAPIDGATESTFEPSENGSFAVEITLGECTKITECMTVGDVSIATSTVQTIQIYPNPVADHLIINTDITILGVVVYDVNGRKVNHINLSNNKIGVSHLNKGVYFIEISTSAGISRKKFTKS